MRQRIAQAIAVVAATCPPLTAQEAVMDLSPNWQYVADRVMGGVSTGQARSETVNGRAAVRLTGTVSLENNGGFIQMGFDLSDGGVFDASAYSGITLTIFGNGAEYDLRVRTDALNRPWQSFRTAFDAPAAWTTLRVPFTDLTPHRTEAAFDPKGLRRIGVVAIGREMQVDVAVSHVGLYR